VELSLGLYLTGAYLLIVLLWFISLLLLIKMRNLSNLGKYANWLMLCDSLLNSTWCSLYSTLVLLMILLLLLLLLL